MKTPVERVLDLAEEYREAKYARTDPAGLGGIPSGREPSVIATDYEAALRDLLT